MAVTLRELGRAFLESEKRLQETSAARASAERAEEEAVLRHRDIEDMLSSELCESGCSVVVIDGKALTSGASRYARGVANPDSSVSEATSNRIKRIRSSWAAAPAPVIDTASIASGPDPAPPAHRLHTLTIAVPSETPQFVTREEAMALFNQLLVLLFPPPPAP